jgi:hypothetical protein
MSCTHDIDMDEPTYPAVVTLQPLNPDGKFVNIEVPGQFIARASGLITDVLADGGDNEAIPLPDIKVDQLNFIVAFYTRYFAEPFDVPDNKGDDMDKWFVLKPGNLVENGFPAWAEEMLDTIPLTDEPIPNYGRFKTMFDMASACDYLNCNKLFYFIWLKFSSMITGKSSEEIRAIFAIENDFDDVDEFHMEREVIVVTNPDGTTREVVREFKVWDKITEATAEVVNSIPV